MGKFKLSKREIKAVKDSIAHWKRDIQAKLIKGIAIESIHDGMFLIWADNSKDVKCRGEDCTLCEIYYYKSLEEIPCVDCPYYKKYGKACTCSDYGGYHTGPWKKFRLNPCLKTCNDMIKALEDILK